MKNVVDFAKVSLQDIALVGGKNASLGEMISQLSQLGIDVPLGFATTSNAYRGFLAANGLSEKIQDALAKVNANDIASLASAGSKVRQWIMAGEFAEDFINDVEQAYLQLQQRYANNITVAVRSSATAEDLPDASFAGQQETYLNVTGKAEVLHCIKKVYASLFTDRAISYRLHQGFVHEQIAISAGIQCMVRSDLAASGVMFSIDTESCFSEVVFITSAYGLGESVVQGSVNPDEFYVSKLLLQQNRPAIIRKHLGSKAEKMVYSEEGDEFVKTVAVSAEEQIKFSIRDEDIIALAEKAQIIAKHYRRAMDIEWAKDGIDGKLYIVQARPETVSKQQNLAIEQFCLHGSGPILTQGRSIGQRIGQGRAKVIASIHEIDKVEAGDVLVTDMTDPDWEPIMKKASAIVTNRGGRTCHAAIIAREMGIPAVVGCGNATDVIGASQTITVSCAEGDTGYIYQGLLEFDIQKVTIDNMPNIPIKVMMNVGDPNRAFALTKTPNAGVGLARLEFIINRMIGFHPRALLEHESMPENIREKIHRATHCYPSPRDFYIEKLSEGIATLACAFHPDPVIVRLSDFKSNEYENLIGGELFEPKEDNPMLGFRGAGRYVSEEFKQCFALECEAIKNVRDKMGLTNVEVMVPFVRTLQEAEQVIDTLAEHGLKRGENALRIIMMCEIPSNAILANEFLQFFDGFSIGSNDLTQLTLGLDRDSSIVAHAFDERDAAVKFLLQRAISACIEQGKYIGICGQGPSDYPDFAKWLIEQGITSISLNPDTVLKTWLYLADEMS